VSREAIWQFALNDSERSAVSWREIAEEEQARWLAARDEYDGRMHRSSRDSALKRAEEHERAAEELREKIRTCKHEVLIVTCRYGVLGAMCELCGKRVEDPKVSWRESVNFAGFASLIWDSFYKKEDGDEEP
jgi:hypothetical protein